MRRIPETTARRIDRLARSAHAFHRFAHHPLCDRYAPEVLRVGRRVRICRGCTFAACGLLAGAACGALVSSPPWLHWAALAGAIAALLSARRWPKAFSRGLPMGLLAFGTTASIASGLAAALVLGGFVLRYRMRGPDRSACAACPERTFRLCSGLAPIIRRERAFQRLATVWIDGARASQRG
jgi:hypothetical protein